MIIGSRLISLRSRVLFGKVERFRSFFLYFDFSLFTGCGIQSYVIPGYKRDEYDLVDDCFKRYAVSIFFFFTSIRLVVTVCVALDLLGCQGISGYGMGKGEQSWIV